MTYRLIRIDELTQKDHYYLDSEDRCFYLMEYTKGKKSDYSSTNQLIHNLKKRLDRRGESDWPYKRKAILKVASILRELFDPKEIPSLTFVPIPPHSHKDDPGYDDRMVQVLENFCGDLNGDIRQILYMTETMQPSHNTSGRRPSPDVLEGLLDIDETTCNPNPTKIVIFDDVITAGSHFKACKAVLQKRFPKARIAGLFIARRVLPEEELGLGE